MPSQATDTPKAKGIFGNLFKGLNGAEVAKNVAAVDVTKLSERLAGDMLAKVTEADALLMHIVERGTKPTVAEIAYFAGQGWDVTFDPFKRDRTKKSLEMEMGRVRRVLQFKAVAGTIADRQALAKEAARTAAERKKRGGEIEEQMRKAQEELSKLERAAATAARRLSEAEGAAENLKQLVPPEIGALANQAQSVAQRSLGDRFREVDARRSELQAIIDMPLHGDEILLYCRRLHRDFIEGGNEKMFGDQVNPTKWDRLVKEAKAELAELMPAWEVAKRELDAAIESAKEPLAFYLV